MRIRFQPVRVFSSLAVGMIAFGLAGTGAAQEAPGESVTGIVDQIQLVDASSMGGGRALILHLESGEAFEFPHTDHVAAGAGVEVQIRYSQASKDGELPIACSAKVLALPLDEESMQQASRPFEVYRNPDC